MGSIAASFDYGLNAAATEYDGQNKYLRITDIDDTTHEFLKSDLTTPWADLAMSADYLLEEGDLLFARTGASVGKTYLYRQYDGTVYFAGFLIRARIGESADPEFVYQATLTDAYKKYVAITSQRSGQPGVNAQEYADYQLMLPSRTEQQQIGMTLRSLDNLITLHQRKCQCRSLCGYLSWEQRKLGELGFAQSGIGFPDTEQGGTEGTPFFKVSDMNMPGNEHELVASNNYVTPEQIARMGWHPINQVPAIFFAKVGAAVMLNRKRLVNKPFLLDNNTMAFSMDSSLLNTQFGQSLFERLDLTSLIQVGALPSYNSSDVESITVSLPSTMDEQRRIGQCLCNINDLITLHQ